MQNITIKNTVTIPFRVFPVAAHDRQADESISLTVPVTKMQLQAAQIVGQSSKELIERLCDRQGYTVLEIGTPEKLSVTVDLDKLVRGYEERQEAIDREEWMLFHSHERRGAED